jgi:hypothetical protein
MASRRREDALSAVKMPTPSAISHRVLNHSLPATLGGARLHQSMGEAGAAAAT